MPEESYIEKFILRAYLVAKTVRAEQLKLQPLLIY